MKIKYLILFVISFDILIAKNFENIQSPDSTEKKIVKKDIELTTILRNTVSYIYEDKTPSVTSALVAGNILGTAFLISIPLNDTSKSYIPFIVTAKHVIGNKKSILVRFNSLSGKEPVFIKYDLDKLKSENDYWEEKEIAGTDIVLFRTMVYDNIKFEPLPKDLIASEEVFKSENIIPTDRIFIPCLMGNFPGTSQNYPIFRDGSIALITEEPIDFTWKLEGQEQKTKQKMIFINTILNEGFSGAPVFLQPGIRINSGNVLVGGKLLLLGVVHGFFPIKRNIVNSKDEDVMLRFPKVPISILDLNYFEAPIYSQENSGIGVVFPSWIILKIINTDLFKKRIDVILNR